MSEGVILTAVLVLSLLAPGPVCAAACSAEDPGAAVASAPCHQAPEAAPASSPSSPDPDPYSPDPNLPDLPERAEGCPLCEGTWLSSSPFGAMNGPPAPSPWLSFGAYPAAPAGGMREAGPAPSDRSPPRRHSRRSSVLRL